MPGLRPGMGAGGLGGPIGPNVGPGLRRPGLFPPGVPATAGDYGLPAASRYGHGGPSRPGQPAVHDHLTPDTGIGNTTSESSGSSSPSATTAEIVTPVTAHIHMEPTVVHPPPIPALTPSADTVSPLILFWGLPLTNRMTASVALSTTLKLSRKLKASIKTKCPASCTA